MAELWPPTPDLRPAVLAAIADDAPAGADGRAPGRDAVTPRRARRRRLALAAAALALLIPATVAFGDDVLEWLGLRSVEVRRVPQLPPGPKPPTASELGNPVTRAQAAERAGFEPVLIRSLGPPDAIRERDGVVTVVYDDVRLEQRAGALERPLLEKVVDGNEVRRVPEGLFIEGRHFYLYVDDLDEIREGNTRVANSTLITERGDLLLRLEGEGLSYDRARELIADARP